MKRRQTAVQAEVTQLLATSMGGQLRSGDSIGVWTFGQELNTAKFPEQRWMPADAVTIASDINKFVGKQRFTGNTRFERVAAPVERDDPTFRAADGSDFFRRRG